ncbi:hypothetical protein QCA50_010977 [Cerrena zonata]|uniref:UvrD-like helicase ATP-binding domain-containing protein n=1 Tax=Cerrena zonata TaxID=2478898 RepID=A0AAW0FX56_9APHY
MHNLLADRGKGSKMVGERLAVSQDHTLGGPPIDWFNLARTTTWLLMDEAQDTYWDLHLWIYMKNIPSRLFIVFFATYETAGNEPMNYSGRRLPFSISPLASVFLRPTEWVNHGLCFTLEEFNEYITSRTSAGFRTLQKDLQSWMYRISDFSKHFTNPRDFINGLTHPAFTAGLPTPDDIKTFEQFFYSVLKRESTSYPYPHYDTSKSAKKMGWVVIYSCG